MIKTVHVKDQRGKCAGVTHGHNLTMDVALLYFRQNRACVFTEEKVGVK